MPLPSFIVIGPGRSGSTWTYELLRAHPDVCMAKGTKETLFFESEYEKGADWYQSFFSDCEPGQAIGEISNTYIYNAEVPRRVYEVVPEVKLITCLRNPIERIQSVYLYNQRNGRLRVEFDEALQEHQFLIEQNRYWSLLQNFLDYFGEEQLHILFYEDLRDKPRAFAEQLCDIIGVRPDGIDEALVGERVNAGAQARHWLLGRVASWIAKALRATGNHALLDTLKRQDVLRSMVLRQLSKDEKHVVSRSTHNRLLEEYEPEIRAIEDFTGRNLQAWRKLH